jgi:hypothetical protein
MATETQTQESMTQTMIWFGVAIMASLHSRIFLCGSRPRRVTDATGGRPTAARKIFNAGRAAASGRAP